MDLLTKLGAILLAISLDKRWQLCTGWDYRAGATGRTEVRPHTAAI